MSKIKNNVDETYHVVGGYVELRDEENDDGRKVSRIIQRCSICGYKLLDLVTVNTDIEEVRTYKTNSIVKVISVNDGETEIEPYPNLEDYPHPQCLRFIE
jgi:hypothetical protein